MLHVDDLKAEHFPALPGFQQGLLDKDSSSKGILLQSFREHLNGLYRFWDTIPANAIVLSALECINGRLLEQNPAIHDMKLSEAAQSWPYFLRNKTGCSAAYAFMVFPKCLNMDLSIYMSVVEDMVVVTNLANDVLSCVFSFYLPSLGV